MHRKREEQEIGEILLFIAQSFEPAPLRPADRYNCAILLLMRLLAARCKQRTDQLWQWGLAHPLLNEIHIASQARIQIITRIRTLFPATRINFIGANIEEFGYIYERLLDFTFAENGQSLIPSPIRRATGAHYTPRELTVPLVKHALDPLVYVGPAEGWAEQEWQLRAPDEILALRVCDMTVGAGAFLIQACHYLSEKLICAWKSKGKFPPMDQQEEYTQAKKLICEQCLYGVDKNPVAVEVAKLSLGLMIPGKSFISLDHHIRCGDALLGIHSEEEITNDALRSQINKLVANRPNERNPFHWPLEFPEVFIGKGNESGFYAMVGNPPFMGGSKITGILGTDYRDYLVKQLANGKRGNADICAYFFLRATKLVKHEGMSALLATNTIAQGDTREVGLDQITKYDWVIPRALPSQKWPGEASLEISHIWMKHGKWHNTYILEDKIVESITPFLTASGRVHGNPYQLKGNSNKSFNGSKVDGMGFVLTTDEAQALIAKDPRNKDVLFPYLNGEDLNTRPDQSSSRWIINFCEWPLELAETYSDCIQILRERVKPEREIKSEKRLRDNWWIYKRSTQALYAAITNMKRVLVTPRVSKYMICTWGSNCIVYSEQTCVIVTESNKDFALIQCSFHDSWTFQYASTLGKGLRYTPSDCFETFPFPSSMDNLEDIGERYYLHRQAIMLARQEGLTKTYNRFHDAQEHSADIVKLRELHREMDEAVAHAYAWDDLQLDHGFHETKQGLRYTISEAARCAVLDRLLLLNHQRHEEELS